MFALPTMADAAQPAPKSRNPYDRSIVEGPIGPAVWKLAWPTMLQNVVAGLQGVVDHILVGNLIGYTANAAIGISWQIFLVVIVFMASLFTGQAVLVARFVGANQPEKVNRTVFQAFLTAVAMFAVMGPFGYFAAPYLLDLVNAAPEVKAQALPFLRINFSFSIGMMLFFMLSTALRAAGDARTPLRLGVSMTVLNLALNLVLVPRFGTTGSAMGTVTASGLVSAVALYMLFKGKLVVRFSHDMDFKPDWAIIRSLFRFGLPTGVQGIAMNVAGVLLLRFIGSLEQSAAAQAAFAIGYTELFSLITWTSVGLMGAAATVAGQNLGAGHADRAMQGVRTASRIGLWVAFTVGLAFVVAPHFLLGLFGANEAEVARLGEELLQYLAVSGFFITVALTYTGGLQGTGDTRSPLYITLASQIAVPIGLCFAIQAMRPLEATDIWTAIVLGHFTRALLTFLRFRQGRWRQIKVEIEGQGPRKCRVPGAGVPGAVRSALCGGRVPSAGGGCRVRVPGHAALTFAGTPYTHTAHSTRTPHSEHAPRTHTRTPHPPPPPRSAHPAPPLRTRHPAPAPGTPAPCTQHDRM
ncbi:MAG: MATE family efflux transporter [Vicinamibacterales bacterium]